MNRRRTAPILVVALLALCLLPGCLWGNRRDELPRGRRPQVTVFPVRHLKFENVLCTQELDQMEISGSLQNVSPYELSNLRLRIDIYFASDPAKANIETLIFLVEPSPLAPSEWGHFSISEVVEHPVAHVEIRAFWD